MAGKTGNQKVIEQLLLDGINVMFGCPGTVEQGILDALSLYPEMKYILSLQESIAVMMADGYARATQSPTLVQLHSSPGIGNGVGALYQAKRGHSPLVVIAGDAGLKYFNMDAQMSADLIAMMEPVTKFATCVYSSKNLLRTLRKAIKIASTPPMGPVYVCLPADVMDEINEESLFPTSILSTKVYPNSEFIQKLAVTLLNAKNPTIFIGDGIAYSSAETELTTVAGMLGAEVYDVDSGELNMDHSHPCYRGGTGHMFGFQSKPITQKGDAILILGTYMVPEVYPDLGDIYSPDARVFHIDLNSYEIAKNHRVDYGITADPKLALSELITEIKNSANADQIEKASVRFNGLKKLKEDETISDKQRDIQFENSIPLHPSAFMKELSKHVPDDVMIFDEALTASPDLTRYIPPKYPGHYMQTRGGSLGTGFPGAIGMKLANPDKTVIGFSGDGGSLFTIQALATAAKYNIDVKFVVCNNNAYKLLELNLMQYRRENNISDKEFPEAFFLDNPIIEFSVLAESMKVPGIKVKTHDEIKPAIEKMLSTKGPFLIDLIVTPEVSNHKWTRKIGQ